MTNGWPILEATLEYENPYFGVERLRVEQPSGRPNDYYRMRTDGDGVLAVAVQDGRLLLVEVYRPRLGDALLEVPGGGIEGEESPETAAHREFTEETGYTADSAEYVGSFYPSAWTSEKQHVVWLSDIDPTPEARPNREEEIRRMVAVPTDEAFSRVTDGPTAGCTVTALQLAQQADLLSLTNETTHVEE